MDWRTRDPELVTVADITARIASLEKRRENEHIPIHGGNLEAYQTRLAKLTRRIDALWLRRAALLRNS